MGRVLRRLESYPTPSISEEDREDPGLQQEGHLVVNFRSSRDQHKRPQDIKVDLGLFSTSVSVLGYSIIFISFQL